jgi:hypothetical protein
MIEVRHGVIVSQPDGDDARKFHATVLAAVGEASECPGDSWNDSLQ